MQETPYLLGFTAGELSPWLSCRFDLQAYQRGAALLENFFVQPYGGIQRRPGSTYVGPAPSATRPIRFFPFRFNETEILQLEFSPGKLRIYKNGALLQVNNTTYELDTPWTTDAQVKTLHFAQLNDVIYVTCPYAVPRILKHLADTNWVIEEVYMAPYPRERYGAQDSALRVTITPAGIATVESDTNIFDTAMEGKEYIMVDTPAASQMLFLNESISLTTTAMPDLETITTPTFTGKVYYEANPQTGMNEYYTCYRRYTKNYYNGSASAKDYGAFFYPGAFLLNNGAPYEVCGDWELRTNGVWNAKWEIWRSYDDYRMNGNFHYWNWTCIKTFEQSAHSARENWAITGSEDRPCRLMVVCRASDNTTISPMMYMKIYGGTREYKLQITTVNSARKATCASYSPFCLGMDSFTSYRWSFGAIGVRNGYPAFSCFHQGRLWFGGMPGLPTTLVASAVEDFPNFGVTSASDSALHLTLASTDQCSICWLCPSRSLLVGTTAGEWTLSAPDGGCITPGNATFVRQSSVGSDRQPASGVENTVFFVQRGGKRLREISYKLEADGFTTTDTSLLAEHLFAPGISEWVVQRGTNTLLWVLMKDGSLAVLTINVEQRVTAWQRVSFGGRKVLHIAGLPSAESNEDELWLVVLGKAGNTASIERIGAGECYVDGCYTGTLKGQPHLAGLRGYAYREGQPDQAFPIEFSSTGTFTLPSGTNTGGTWCIGAAIRSELHTMPLEQEGSFNTIRQEGRVRLRLLNSNPSFDYCSGNASRWEVYQPAQDHLPTDYSGSVRLSHIPSPGVGQDFRLRVDSPLPFRLLAMTIEFDYHGR